MILSKIIVIVNWFREKAQENVISISLFICCNKLQLIDDDNFDNDDNDKEYENDDKDDDDNDGDDDVDDNDYADDVDDNDDDDDEDD